MARKQTPKTKKVSKKSKKLTYAVTEKETTKTGMAPLTNFYLVSSFTVGTQVLLQNVFTIVVAASPEEAMQRARQKYNNKALTVTKIQLGEYLSYAEC